MRSDPNPLPPVTPEPMTPALTPEQWREKMAKLDRWDTYAYHDLSFDNRNNLRVVIEPEASTLDAAGQHALAALCLYQQPFGFTQADVELLAAIANDYAMQMFRFHGKDLGSTGDYLAGLASRIQSLLPPEKP